VLRTTLEAQKHRGEGERAKGQVKEQQKREKREEEKHKGRNSSRSWSCDPFSAWRVDWLRRLLSELLSANEEQDCLRDGTLQAA